MKGVYESLTEILVHLPPMRDEEEATDSAAFIIAFWLGLSRPQGAFVLDHLVRNSHVKLDRTTDFLYRWINLQRKVIVILFPLLEGTKSRGIQFDSSWRWPSQSRGDMRCGGQGGG